MRRLCAAILTVCLLLVIGSRLFGATVAYWRFEEGTVDQPAPAPYESDWFVDSSGSGNDMWTFADFTAPWYRSDVPGDPVPQTGAPNALALDFSPNQDNYTSEKPINSHSFSQLTVEASVKLDTLDRWQVIVGKDGKPTDEPFPPFFFKAWHIDAGANLEVGLIDASGVWRGIASMDPPVVGEWYHLAMTNDGSTMRFYIKGPGDAGYVEQGATEVDGALIDSEGAWTVGRGMWDGGIADWADGAIDEVRISDVALSPSHFLWVPEPSTLALVGSGLLGLLAAAWRRR